MGGRGKNGRNFIGHGTLKSVVSQEWIDELKDWIDLLYADANLGKLNVTLIIIGWDWSKMGVAF